MTSPATVLTFGEALVGYASVEENLLQGQLPTCVSQSGRYKGETAFKTDLHAVRIPSQLISPMSNDSRSVSGVKNVSVTEIETASPLRTQWGATGGM